MFKSHPVSVFPFSCLVRTFPVIPPRLLAVTPLAVTPLAVTLYLRPPEQCGVQIPRGANYFGSGIRKLFSTAYTVMVSSTGAIFMEPIKLIITHNVDAQLSYRTGVGSNLTRPQCLSIVYFNGLTPCSVGATRNLVYLV